MVTHGLWAAEIRVLLPRIRGFSDLGNQFFEPLRTYCSGMNVRLVFSLATAVRRDVLIIDEVLAVGDRISARRGWPESASCRMVVRRSCSFARRGNHSPRVQTGIHSRSRLTAKLSTAHG